MESVTVELRKRVLERLPPHHGLDEDVFHILVARELYHPFQRGDVGFHRDEAEVEHGSAAFPPHAVQYPQLMFELGIRGIAVEPAELGIARGVDGDGDAVEPLRHRSDDLLRHRDESRYQFHLCARRLGCVQRLDQPRIIPRLARIAQPEDRWTLQFVQQARVQAEGHVLAGSPDGFSGTKHTIDRALRGEFDPRDLRQVQSEAGGASPLLSQAGGSFRYSRQDRRHFGHRFMFAPALKETYWIRRGYRNPQ